ncbi:MAG: type IV pilin [Halapricum sp.]
MSAGDPQPRGISEMASVLTLVAFTLVLVVAVGASVLFFQPQPSHPEASFTFEYYDSASTLLVTHSAGDKVRAGDLLIRGPRAQSTWAEINQNMNDSSMVGRNDAIQVGRKSGYGTRIRASDHIAVVYVNTSTNTTAVLSQWNGTNGA